jgi:uncharacterized protein YigA (DUF484 family)
MNETDVADFLLTHPAFFERHAELLGHIKLANPHGSRAVSLSERQIEILREKNRQLERRLAELVRFGHENDSHAVKFDAWSSQLLLQDDITLLPDVICAGLRTVFDVPKASLRLWGIASAHADHPAARAVGLDIQRYADSLGTPYCGPYTEKGSAAAAWLDDTQADGNAGFLASAPPVTGERIGGMPAFGTSHPATGRTNTDGGAHAAAPSAVPATVQSIALIPLRAPGNAPAASAFGLLVMGSPDPQRFHGGMGTDLLIRIGTLASAALSRLLAR